MAISKVSGKAWADIAKVDGVSATDIAKVSGIDAPSGAATVVSSGLWLYWTPSSVAGTSVLDQSGNGRNATMYNGASVTTTPSGETAFFTDGVNDYINYAFNSNVEKPSTDYPVTHEFWAYRKTGMSGKATTSFMLNDPADTVDWHRLLITQNGNYKYVQKYTYSGGRYVAYSDSSTMANETWYLLGVVIRKTTNQNAIDYYLNGSYVTTVTSTYGNIYWNVPWVDNPTTVNCTVGGVLRSSPSYYHGYHGDVRIYGRALSAAEFLQNFNATKSNYGY